MSDASDVVDSQIEAFRSRDIDQFLSHYGDDVSVVLFDGSPMIADKQAMRAAYGALFANSPDLQVTIANRIVIGDFVVDEEHLQGFHLGDAPTEFVAAAVYRVVDKRIARLQLLM
jgi:hypothetical protein